MAEPKLAGDGLDDMMASIAKAQRAVSEREDRVGCGVPTNERTDQARDLVRRIPAFLRGRQIEEMRRCLKDDRLHRAASWWSWGKGSMLLLAPSGHGKTTALGIVVRRMVHVGEQNGGGAWSSICTLRWYAATELALARKHHPLGAGEAPEVTRAKSARLLVVDDVGWENDPTTLSEVLNARMERQLPTLMTSGLERNSLLQVYGAAVIRKLLDSGAHESLLVDCYQ